MSSTWASVVPAGTVPKDTAPPLRRPLCPSCRAGFEPIPTKSGASRASGLICGSWERRRPGPASAASRSLQKIVGVIVGAASRAGREHLQGSSPPDSTLSRIRGDLDVRVPRRSARARASVRRWLWSSRRGRSGDNRPLYALKLDSAVVPSVRGQPGATVSVHSGVQPWELPSPVMSAQGGQARW